MYAAYSTYVCMYCTVYVGMTMRLQASRLNFVNEISNPTKEWLPSSASVLASDTSQRVCKPFVYLHGQIARGYQAIQGISVCCPFGHVHLSIRSSFAVRGDLFQLQKWSDGAADWMEICFWFNHDVSWW